MATINGTAYGDTLTGTTLDDIINGLAGNDTINGGAGNDTITGGAGNDVINGGTGTNTAVFSGSRANYAISTAGMITVKALSGTDGTDSLSNIRYVRFADQTVKLLDPPSLSVANAQGGAGTPISLDQHITTTL